MYNTESSTLTLCVRQNTSPQGSQVFAVVINFRILSWRVILDYLGGPTCIKSQVSLRDAKGDLMQMKEGIQTKEEAYMTQRKFIMLALKIRMMQPHAKESWHPPEPERGKNGFSSRACGRNAVLLTLLLCSSDFNFCTSDLQNCEGRNFCCFKLPNLWYSFIVVIEN